MEFTFYSIGVHFLGNVDSCPPMYTNTEKNPGVGSAKIEGPGSYTIHIYFFLALALDIAGEVPGEPHLHPTVQGSSRSPSIREPADFIYIYIYIYLNIYIYIHIFSTRTRHRRRGIGKTRSTSSNTLDEGRNFLRHKETEIATRTNQRFSPMGQY